MACLLASACGPPPRPASPEVMARAHASAEYQATVEVKVSGRGLRGRVTTFLAFRRPDGLYVEVPGPGGVRMQAVASGGELVALFPGERAVFRGAATLATFETLFGIGLAPAEVMDVLVGAQPRGVTSLKVWWGPVWPQRVDARVAGGGRLQLKVLDPSGGPVPDQAFRLPAVPVGYREVSADEARRLWSRR